VLTVDNQRCWCARLPDMHSGAAHLSIDLAASSITGVLFRQGQRIPLLFDGQPVMPSGVFVDPETGRLFVGHAALTAAAHRPDHYIPDPLAQSGTGPTSDGALLSDPTDAMSAILQHVAAHAQTPDALVDAVTVSIPPSWGPRRRERLLLAAARVGLPRPTLVTAPAALAAQVTAYGPAVPEGACVLVCQADAHPMSLTMLQAVAGGFRELGTTALAYPDGADIDQTLTHRAIDASGDIELRRRIDHPSELEDHRTRWILLHHIRQLRHTLLTQERAPVLLPEPHPPAVLTHHDLSTAIQPLLDQLPTSVAELLTATDVGAAQIHIVILHTNTALPGLQDHLAAATHRPATVITGHPHATADGAFLLTAPATGRPTAATTRIARVRLRITDLVGAVIIGGCSLALLIQAITTTYTVTIDAEIAGAVVPSAQLGAAALLTVLTAITVAHLAPTTWLAGTPANPESAPTTGILIRRAYLTAAATGATVATLYGLATGSAFGLDITPHLQATLIAALPLTIYALLTAAMAPRIPITDLPDWLQRARPAALPVALATAGVLLMRAAVAVPDVPGLAGRAGAALLGVATVLTATRHTLLRAITAPILAVGYALVFALSTTPVLIVGYLFTLTWWAAHLTAHTLRAAFPTTRAKLRRLLDGPFTG
jgi:hypothetical protein